MDEELREGLRALRTGEMTRAQLLARWIRSGELRPWRVALAASLGCEDCKTVIPSADRPVHDQSVFDVLWAGDGPRCYPPPPESHQRLSGYLIALATEAAQVYQTRFPGADYRVGRGTVLSLGVHALSTLIQWAKWGNGGYQGPRDTLVASASQLGVCASARRVTTSGLALPQPGCSIDFPLSVMELALCPVMNPQNDTLMLVSDTWFPLNLPKVYMDCMREVARQCALVMGEERARRTALARVQDGWWE